MNISKAFLKMTQSLGNADRDEGMLGDAVAFRDRLEVPVQTAHP